jgi:hypothetical protein
MPKRSSKEYRRQTNQINVARPHLKQVLPNNSGSFATLAGIRRASCFSDRSPLGDTSENMTHVPNERMLANSSGSSPRCGNVKPSWTG